MKCSAPTLQLKPPTSMDSFLSRVYSSPVSPRPKISDVIPSSVSLFDSIVVSLFLSVSPGSPFCLSFSDLSPSSHFHPFSPVSSCFTFLRSASLHSATAGYLCTSRGTRTARAASMMTATQARFVVVASNIILSGGDAVCASNVFLGSFPCTG